MAKPDAERIAVWNGLRTSQARIAAALDSGLRTERGMSLTWYEVLDALISTGGSTVGQLCRHLAVNSTTLSRRLDRLQDDGLILRKTDSRDARIVIVTITSAGRALFRSAQPTWRRILQREFAASLTDTDVAAVLRITGKLDGQ